MLAGQPVNVPEGIIRVFFHKVNPLAITSVRPAAYGNSVLAICRRKLKEDHPPKTWAGGPLKWDASDDHRPSPVCNPFQSGSRSCKWRVLTGKVLLTGKLAPLASGSAELGPPLAILLGGRDVAVQSPID